MKKITENFKTLSLVIVLLFPMFHSFATDNQPTVKILDSKDKTFVLVANNNHNSNLTIRIIDTYQEVLLTDKISVNNSFTKKYNLAQLPNGIYEVEIENELYIQKQIVKLSTKGLEILEREERRIFKPYIKTKGQTIILNYLSAGNTKVVIAILDSEGDLVFSKTYEQEKTIHQNFDLSKFDSGQYLVRVKTDENVFRKFIALK